MSLNPEEQRVFEALKFEYDLREAPLAPGYFLERINDTKNDLVATFEAHLDELGGIEGSKDFGRPCDVAALLVKMMTIDKKHAVIDQGTMLYASGRGMALDVDGSGPFFTNGAQVRGRYVALTVAPYWEFDDAYTVDGARTSTNIKKEWVQYGIHLVLAEPELIHSDGETTRIDEDIALLPLHYDELVLERIVVD